MVAFLFFLLFSAFNAVHAQQRPSNISRGSSLTPTGNSTNWLSPSGLFAFGFFPHDRGSFAIGIFFAGLSEKTVVWTVNTANPAVSSDATLLLSNDGRLVLQQTGLQAQEVVDHSWPIDSAAMLDNGNFVIYNNNSVIWQSFDHPTNTLLSGQRLPPTHELFSSASDNDYTRGIFRLKMQSDGNLVQYPVNTDDISRFAYYSSETVMADMAGSNVSLNLDANGHLYLYNRSSGSSFKNFTTAYSTESRIYLLRIDVDGIFRVYYHSLNQGGNWTVQWRPPRVDNCQPKGLCGFNSYCVLRDEVAACVCLPGFYSIQPGNQTAGCVRSFTADGCDNKNFKYEIRIERSTTWDNNPYDTLNTISEQGCMDACRDDCNCEVAFYKAGECSKQRPPLRYGRRLPSDSNNVLIKVVVPTSTPDTSGVSDNASKGIKKQLRANILAIGIALIITAVIFMVISTIYVHRKQVAYKKITQHREAGPNEDVALRPFSYADLVRATNAFKEELGRGASSTVFKGILRSSQKVVAVKRLEKECGGEKEFQTEMETIGKTYHRNLVRLLGYSLDGPHRLLVFEYMSSGSLADILFDHENRPSWEDRVNIARDIARGILYLHEECETQIIHCDIKSKNILMDEHRCAKISDFGLAKLLKRDQTNTMTGIRGTKGYVAPEWHRRQPITVKADVYSFGIVLLEIICCRKSINWNLAEDEAVLEEWVYDCYNAGEAGNLVGDEIVEKRKLDRMVKIGLWCIQDEPSLRPSMRKVLLMLEGTVDIPVPPNPSSFLSSAA